MRKFKKKQAGFLLNPFRFGGAAPSGDPFFANVSYLTHAGGANNSIVLTDSANTPVVLARTGTPVISTAQSRFGEASIAALSTGYFGGSDPDFAFGTGDFTIECWLYWVTASGATQPGAFQVCTTTGGVQASAVNNIALLCNSGSTYAIYANSRSMASAAVIATGVWAHTAIVRTAGVITLYVNGAVILSEADTNNYAGTGIAIGGYYSTAYNFDGYIDEFRVTKGVARYTAAFTPPTQAFPDAGSATDPFFANVMLLTHFNGVNGATTTVDSSSKARALTVNGAVSLSDAQVKFGTAASLFAGGYWTSPASADFAFPGDFTIEFQARKSANGTNGYDMVMLTDTSNGSATNGWFVELSSLRGFVFAYAGVWYWTQRYILLIPFRGAHRRNSYH